MIFERENIDKFKAFLRNMMPGISRSVLPARMFKKPITDFFLDTIKQTVDYMEKNNISKNNTLNLLIKLKNNQKLEHNTSNSDAKANS